MALGDSHRLAVVLGGEDGRGGQQGPPSHSRDHFVCYAGYLCLRSKLQLIVSTLLHVMFVICGRSMWRSSFSQVIVV